MSHKHTLNANNEPDTKRYKYASNSNSSNNNTHKRNRNKRTGKLKRRERRASNWATRAVRKAHKRFPTKKKNAEHEKRLEEYYKLLNEYKQKMERYDIDYDNELYDRAKNYLIKKKSSDPSYNEINATMKDPEFLKNFHYPKPEPPVHP